MKPISISLLHGVFLISAVYATPEKQAEGFYERAVAAEQRGELISADHLYSLAVRANPEHLQAQGKLKEIEERVEPITKTMAKNKKVEAIYMSNWEGSQAVYRDRNLRNTCENFTALTGIPLIIENFGQDIGRLSLNMKNVTVIEVLDEITKQTGFVPTYERHAIRITAPVVPLTDASVNASVRKTVGFEGEVSLVEGGKDLDSWVRIWFKGANFYLFCRENSVRAAFKGAVPASVITPGQRLRMYGKVDVFNNKPYIEIFNETQWQLLESAGDTDDEIPWEPIEKGEQEKGNEPPEPQAASKGITILKALYGSQEQFDDGKETDVTQKAQQKVVNGKLYIAHTRNPFGDPHPYKLKILKITYLVDGKNAPSGKPYEFVQRAGEITLEAVPEAIPPAR